MLDNLSVIAFPFSSYNVFQREFFFLVFEVPLTCSEVETSCSQHADCVESVDDNNAYCNCSSPYVDPYLTGSYSVQGVFCLGMI